MSGYAGIVAINSAIDKAVISKNPTTNVPLDADALPTYRLYGPAGILATGSLSYKDTGTISGATNASPTVITSVGHGLTTGVTVTIANILGNTGANGVYQITVIDSNTFSVPVNTGAGGAYSGGGSFHTTGVYDWNVTPTLAANYLSGTIYSVVVFGTVSGTVTILDDFTFQVS